MALSDEQNRFYEVIRVVPNPDELDKKKTHRGYHLVHDADATGEAERVWVDRAPLLRRVAGKKSSLTHYFVGDLPKPVTLEDWQFHWTEGAKRIELDLKASFDIHVRSQDQAKALVARLHAPTGPEKALHALIDGVLHAELQARARNGRNLLDHFVPEGRRAAPGGEPSLHETVSAQVQGLLGGTFFSISFWLASEPPLRLEIDAHRTPFKTADTHDMRHVETTAEVELVNYQAFRQSGLKDRASVERAIRAAIDAAVKKLLFGKPYYTIIAAFDRSLGNDMAIKDSIREEIGRQVGEWGYAVRLFHTLPTLKALQLTRGMRVDVLDQQYRTRNSVGVVKMDVSISVTALDFGRLADLIPPGQEDIEQPLRNVLLDVCRDQVLKIDRKRFNLEFDSAPPGTPSVKRQLTKALTDTFERRYGLKVSVIDIVQSRTEEAERFEALRGAGAWPFRLDISSRANAGAHDAVHIHGEFEVLGMGQDGWEKFESKDFGFRRDSLRWTPSQRAEFERELQADRVSSEEDRERARKARAVRHELAAIASRIAGVLHDALKSLPDLAQRSRDYQGLRNLQQRAFELIKGPIEDEFGLVIKLRKFERQDTATELTNALIHEKKHQAIRQRAESDAEHALEMSSIQRKHDQSRKEMLLGRLSDLKDREAGDEQAEKEEAVILAELKALGGNANWSSITEEELSRTLDAGAASPPSAPSPAPGLLGDELLGPSPSGRRSRLIK